ncbi:tyrosine-type recombinase/integrase [Pseudonocardia charpentierae]|uniref:Tyrosine-type recombinase/integrase n=1 Tax=Pseudonocardia charpentierae TaxID=3075545 RepID=A0ABU2NG40_9PSEU|nr:tyrosine-type recombinase/integrase [Pseudonocardia sp. DSM 45834]MDT0352922.1 tyrosine-type recombinase/integrase [Pseudonocardia sp. DSM 45834]
MRLYAGQDPLTKKRHTLTKTIPPGPGAEKQAEALLERMQREVADRTAPRTSATVDQLLERYLDQFSGGENTLELYRGHIRNHISPLLGQVKVGQLTPETLDSFYAELRRCRAHCGGKRRFVDHRVKGNHECDHRCGPHRCRPLAPTTVRHIHFILSGAYKRAVRWRWLSVSPTEQVDPPPAPRPNPQPPTAEESARIINEAWRDPNWGAFLWVAMTTGARRGELCAIRRNSLNLDPGRETIWLKRAIRRSSNGWAEGGLKTHQQRRIALDLETVDVLRDHMDRCASEAAEAGVGWPADAFLFSDSPEGSKFATPDSVTQRYARMVARLGIVTTLHKLRHYSATELIAAGVDPRTVAGRLGHGGGGTTTLRTYTAWVSESDQRAARNLGARMPRRPAQVDELTLICGEPRHPYQVVAVAVVRLIEAGALLPGCSVPIAADLADEYNVSIATAKRSLRLLAEWGLIARHGRNALVALTSAHYGESE